MALGSLVLGDSNRGGNLACNGVGTVAQRCNAAGLELRDAGRQRGGGAAFGRLVGHDAGELAAGLLQSGRSLANLLLEQSNGVRVEHRFLDFGDRAAQ